MSREQINREKREIMIAARVCELDDWPQDTARAYDEAGRPLRDDARTFPLEEGEAAMCSACCRRRANEMPRFGWVGRGFNSYSAPWRGGYFVWRGADRVFAEWTASDTSDLPYAAPPGVPGPAPSQTGATRRATAGNPAVQPQARRSQQHRAQRGYPGQEGVTASLAVWVSAF